MPRTYRHIQEYEKEIMELRAKGLTRREIGNSLAHTKWECKYHIVFALKYRRQIIYGNITDVGKILRELC